MGFEDQIKLLDESKRYSSRDNYLCAMRSLQKYAPELEYKDVTVKFLEQYEAAMLMHGKTKTTVGMYCRNLRTIFNNAIRNKIIPHDLYPFGSKKDHKYEIPVGNNIKKSLTSEELFKVLNYDPSGTLDEFDIHMFQFSLRCNGMNMADIFELRHENIQGDFIIFDRLKTINTRKVPEPISIYITYYIRQIIDRWRTTDTTNPKSYLFPVYYDGITDESKYHRKRDKIKEINESLKRLRWKLGVESEITTYTARHTWASIMNAHNVNILEISKGLGHTSIATTEKYLSSLNNDEKKRMGSILDDIGNQTGQEMETELTKDSELKPSFRQVKPKKKLKL